MKGAALATLAGAAGLAGAQFWVPPSGVWERLRPPTVQPDVPTPAVPPDATPSKKPRESFRDWLNRQVFDRVDVAGSRTLSYRRVTIDGDREAYRSLLPFGRGDKDFNDFGQMTLNGRNVLGVLNFQASLTFADEAYRDPQAERVSLDYARGPWSINLGDIQGALVNTNPFVPYSANLKGVQAGYRSGRFQARALRSETKGSPKTISLNGANTAGPYYLQASQIIRDSVQVVLDGRPMRLGVDYVVDYEFGSITFIDRIIPPTSTIVVSFESLNFNVRVGTVQGVGATYDFGRIGRLGVTRIEQKRGGGGGLTVRIERFQGFGPPSTPYFLQFEPLTTRPIVVRVDGVVQQPNIDYVFDSVNPVIFYMRRFVPSTSTVEVQYTPRPTSIIDGDREVTGWDWRIPLGAGDNRFVQYSQATGRLSNTATPLKGTARGIEARYGTSRYDLGVRLSDIPDGYTTVESRGFNRNARTAEANAEFRQRGLTYGANYSNSSISSRGSDNQGRLTFNDARTTLTRLYVNRRPGEVGGWNLEHTMASSLVTGQRSRLNTTSLTTARNFGNNGELRTTWALERQEGRGPIQRDNVTREGTVSLNTLRSTLAYDPGGPWSFNTRAGISNIRSLGETGNGTDLSFAAGYRPDHGQFSIDTIYRQSNAGQVAALGSFDSGLGFGFGGSGFAGAPIGLPLTSIGSDFRLYQLSTSWRIPRGPILTADAYQARTSGTISSNSETTGFSTNVVWSLPRNHTAVLGLNNARTRLLQGGDGSNVTSLLGAFDGNPPGRLSYNLNVASMVSPNSGQFSQDSLSYGASVTYRLNRDQRFSIRGGRNRITGYLPQDETRFDAEYEYRLFRTIALVGAYRVRDVRNLDPLQTSGAYRSRGFEFELRFDFAP